VADTDARRGLLAVLDLARWAPSGDNTQPWRFRIVADNHVAVHGFDTRTQCVYDLDGHPSQISIGAMLETMRIAASGQRMKVDVARRTDAPDEHPIFDVRFAPDRSLAPSPLLAAIEARAVQRRALSTRALTDAETFPLASCLPAGYTVVWLAGALNRWRVAKILFASAKIRLTMPEAFETHRSVIEWNARFSADRIPAQALGADPLTLRLMRWAMQDWARVRFMNRFLAGTVAPRLQLDLVPALACAAHLLILAENPPARIDDYVAAGGAVQRFWLTATTLGLLHQPEITPLIFARYARERRTFSATPGMSEAAQRVRESLEPLLGADALARAVWMGRIGAGRAPSARSLRLPLEKLLLPS
jgi:nitroreductase